MLIMILVLINCTHAGFNIQQFTLGPGEEFNSDLTSYVVDNFSDFTFRQENSFPTKLTDPDIATVKEPEVQMNAFSIKQPYTKFKFLENCMYWTQVKKMKFTAICNSTHYPGKKVVALVDFTTGEDYKLYYSYIKDDYKMKDLVSIQPAQFELKSAEYVLLTFMKQNSKKSLNSFENSFLTRKKDTNFFTFNVVLFELSANKAELSKNRKESIEVYTLDEEKLAKHNSFMKMTESWCTPTQPSNPVEIKVHSWRNSSDSRTFIRIFL